MSKRSIQFACILFILTAILAVSAQENTTAMNNASMNNITLLNNTTQNATTSEPIIVAANESVIEAASNETVSAEIEPAPAPETIPAQNETLLAPIEVVAAQNETATAEETIPSDEIISSENATTAAIESIPAVPVLQPGGMQIGSSQRNTFAIGGIGRTPNQFTIDGKALAQGAYEIGLPAKTIMDLGALPFFVNKI